MKKDIRTYAEGSVILTALSRFLAFFGRGFDSSVSGLISSSAGNTSTLFEASAAGRLLAGQSQRNTFLKRLLRFIASGFENSYFARVTKKCYAALLNIELSKIGYFFATYAIFALFGWLILYYTEMDGGTLGELLIIAGFGVVSLPLSFSRKSLISAGADSRFLGSIFKNNLGVDMQIKIREVENEHFPKKLSGFSFVFGILFGVLSVFIMPSGFLVLAVSVISVLFILSVPEAGIVSLIAAIPLYSMLRDGDIILYALIFITGIAYVGKLIRGKRAFNVGFLDIAVFLLFLIMFTSCFGYASSYSNARTLVIFLLTYFIFVNLIKNRTWLKRCAGALVFSWVMIVFIGIITAILEGVPAVSPYIQSENSPYFVFGIPGGAIYLLMPAVPFVLSVAAESKDKLKKAWLIVFALLIFASVWMGGNSMPLPSLIVGMIVYFLTSMPMAVFAMFPTAVVFIILSGGRFPVISELISRSAAYAEAVGFENKYKRGGVFRALGDYIFTGTGMGDETFSKVYPNYSYAGFEGATDAGGSFFDLLLGCGIIGMAILVLIVFVFARESLGFVRLQKHSDISDKRYASAALSGVIMITLSSFYDNVFENPTVFLYLWVMIAFGISYVRMGRAERRRFGIRRQSTEYSADGELPYVKVHRHEE